MTLSAIYKPKTIQVFLTCFILSAIAITFIVSHASKTEGAKMFQNQIASSSANNAIADGTDFRIAVIPDIQYYTGVAHGGNMNMFLAQMKWIKQHQIDSNIVYVSGMGDTVDDTVVDSLPVAQQWINASTGYYMLEAAPALAYGVTVGNHDELDPAYPVADNAKRHNHPGLDPVRNTTGNYNKYFGVDHFKNRPWYGGHANILGKNNNDCHFDKFTVKGQKYIVIYIPFDNTAM